jgi:hypothetical protein
MVNSFQLTRRVRLPDAPDDAETAGYGFAFTRSLAGTRMKGKAARDANASRAVVPEKSGFVARGA